MELITLAFYKPYGVLSCFTDPEGRPTLAEYIPVPDVYSIGRLDYDSEGLLLLTNSGTLIHRLADPEEHVAKTYLVQVEGIPEVGAIRQLSEGVVIQGKKTRRCEALQIPEPDLLPRSKPITPHGPTAWLRIVLREGRKRQIRHMTAAVGLPTLRIVRVAIGSITLDGLEPGQYRTLNSTTVERLAREL
jgi:23S rRNA pseudouridine2457 synthase